MKILILSDYYLPGYKAGGPTQSLANITAALEEEFTFSMITRDRDYGDKTPYHGIISNSWNDINGKKIYYLTPSIFLNIRLYKILLSTQYDKLYLNSFFSINYTVLPLVFRLLKLIPQKPVIVAPRGELSPGALNLKYIKKRAYLFLAKCIWLYRGIQWHVTCSSELVDVRKWFGVNTPIKLVNNMSMSFSESVEKSPKPRKRPGNLNIIFLSRITRKKNLDIALKILKGIEGKIEMNIYGVIDDEKYWQECQDLIFDLPKNISINYRKCIPHHEVVQTIKKHDLFLLPTRGENYGHVIVESFIAGTPVLISNQTPWRELEKKKIGWDISLLQLDKFQDILQSIVLMEDNEYIKLSEKTLQFGSQCMKNEDVREKMIELFNQA